MDAIILAAVTVVALLIGLVLGWVLGGKPVSAARTECDQLRVRCGDAERDLAAAGERGARADRLQDLLQAVTGERDEAMQEVAGLRKVVERVVQQEQELVALRQQKEELSSAKAAFERGETERRQSFETQLAQVKDLEAKLETRFGDLAGKALETAHDAFLKRASERMTLEGKESQAKLQTMLQPVQDTLKRYEDKLQTVEKERVDQYAGLREAVELVRSGQSQVRDEARNLVNALKNSSKTRGNWGEQSLRNVLEQAGLSPHADFRSEVSVDTEEGRLRPDVIVRLPGGGQMIIDAKVSFNAYMAAHEEIDEVRKAAHLANHLSSVKNHVAQLSSKKYWDQFDGSAELVVMYIAGEHFLNAALDIDPGLWQWAHEKRILLATPTNLVALARTVASYWKQDSIHKEAREIAKLGKDLHSRLSTMAEHMTKVGRNLNTATTAYNAMVGSFEDQVFPQVRKFEAYGAGSAKELTSPLLIEVPPKLLTKSLPGKSKETVAAE